MLPKHNNYHAIQLINCTVSIASRCSNRPHRSLYIYLCNKPNISAPALLHRYIHADHLRYTHSQPTSMSNSIESQIYTILTNDYTPIHLQIINESSMHSVPHNSETHFRIIVVSDKFRSQSIMQRHRAINTSLSDLLQPGKIHALSITAKTIEQWNNNQSLDSSPNCLGGSKHDKKVVAK